MMATSDSPRVTAARLLDDPALPEGARRTLSQIVAARRINRADEQMVRRIAREAADGWS